MKILVLKRAFYISSVLVVCSVSLFSCKKTFDLEPETTLSSTQVYRDVFDADAAVVGIYGKLEGLAKQYVVLNELRADLMEVTNNADPYLREINTHNVSANNPYASPRPFFELINDCNDVLYNFNIMLQQNKFKQAEYDQRYSDIGSLRSWLYLQLGIHFGQVPYVTDPLTNIDAVRDQSKYPLIPFNQLLDSLIAFTEPLPYKLPYPTTSSLVITTDASNTQRFFIEKNAFLGDLYLWKGNYNKAASYYRVVMEGTGYTLSSPFYDFKIRWADVVTNNDLAVGYTRFREMDERTLVDNNSQGWRSMFARPQDATWRWEWLWVLPFNSNFSPQNPFIDLFSNRGGSYLVKPSQQAIDNWNSQTQANGFPYDARGRLTYKILDGQPVIMKYLYNYLGESTLVPTNPLLRNGQWFLNRAGAVHLHYAEAANRDNHSRIAFAIAFNGISANYPAPSGATDVTNYQNTLNEPYPYNFDARFGDAPSYRGTWHQNVGLRGRARLNTDTIPANISRTDSINLIEPRILNEGALELAYEGYRWPDLLRIALRRLNDPGSDPAFLANKIYDKLRKDGDPAAADVRTKLLNKDNWYLPFKW
jgi:starch-binding outer membrane protein, SusD/RagB family